MAHRSDDLIVACPECDSASVKCNVCTDLQGPNRDDVSRYKCEDCGNRFQEFEAVHRERKIDVLPRKDSIARALHDADPDDLATDGGSVQDETDETGARSADGTERFASSITDKPVGEEIEITIAGETHVGEVDVVESTVSSGGIPRVGETVTFKAVGGEVEKTVSSIVDGQSYPIRFREGGAAEPQHLVEYSKTEEHKIIRLPDGREIWAGGDDE